MNLDGNRVAAPSSYMTGVLLRIGEKTQGQKYTRADVESADDKGRGWSWAASWLLRDNLCLVCCEDVSLPRHLLIDLIKN